MPFSSGRYTVTHKAWDHQGNVIPNVEHSEGERPAGEFKPAAWLPVQFYEKFFENWITVMPGKILAVDNQGRLCPAQYGLTGAQITYTADDYTAGTIDARTGVAYTTNGTTTFNVSAATDFMGTGETMTVSKPIGVCAYPFIKWAGDGTSNDTGNNPGAYVEHNYNMQHQVALLCDYILELPLMPATTSTEAITQNTRSGNVVTFNALSALPVAVNTSRTPFTFAEGAGAPGDVATKFAHQVENLTDIAASGDWHVNYTTGVITVYSSFDIGGTDYTLTYSNYASAPTGSNVSKFACVLGDIDAGDFLKCNADSNWVVATAKTNGDGVTDAFDTFADIMGQALEVVSLKDQSRLDLVRTAYSSLGSSGTGAYPGSDGQMDAMPGSASGGVPAKIQYAGAADLVVRVNLISR